MFVCKADNFLTGDINHLQSATLEKVCQNCSNKANIDFEWAEGYDHGFYFQSTFAGEHLAFHAKHLQ